MKQASTYFEENLKSKHKDAYWSESKIYILNRDGYELNGDIDWLADPYNHRSWKWLFNNFKWMDTLLYNYIRKNDSDAITKSVAYFFSWYNFYITQKKNGEFLWKDDAVSFRAFRVALVTRHILNSSNYSDEEKQLARNAINLHYNELIDEKKFKRNNHGLFQMRGLMTISTIHSDLLDLKTAREYTESKVNYLWNQQYGKQRIHLENSPGYHQLIIKEFDEILRSPEFKECEFIYCNEDIEKVIDHTKYFYHPNGVSTLFGDSNLSIKEIARFTGDRLFNEAGYAFLAGQDETANNSYLAVRTGFPSNIHRHSDDFSFEWSERGQVILQDSGRYSYEYENPMRVFLTSSRAHNTVTVNGENYPWWGQYDRKRDFYEGAVKQYLGDSDNAEIELEKEFSSLEVNFNRKFELVRGKELKVIDYLSSKNENIYEQWFHLAEPFEYIGVNTDESLRFSVKDLIVDVYKPEGAEVVLSRGQEAPYIQGWVSYKEKHLSKRWSLGFIKKGKNVSLSTVIKLKVLD